MSDNDNVYHLSARIMRTDRQKTDKRVNAFFAEFEHENTLLPETPLRLLQKALKIYRAAKPVLTVIVKLPIVPTRWAAVIDAFMRSLDAVDVPEVIGEIAARFKAGKDLAEAA